MLVLCATLLIAFFNNNNIMEKTEDEMKNSGPQQRALEREQKYDRQDANDVGENLLLLLLCL